MTREEAITTLDILLATEKAAYKGLIPRENSLHITEIEALDMLLKEALQERPKGRWKYGECGVCHRTVGEFFTKEYNFCPFAVLI